MPGTGRENGEWGRCRPGLSCSTTRLPPAWCRAWPRPCLQRVQQGNTVTCREAAHPRQPGAGTSLVRALALHGVARHCDLRARDPRNTVRLRSHLASPLRPGRGVLIRSVSRRLGSVACVREDASPNEVSFVNHCRGCPIRRRRVNLSPVARRCPLRPHEQARQPASAATGQPRGWRRWRRRRLSRWSAGLSQPVPSWIAFTISSSTEITR